MWNWLPAIYRLLENFNLWIAERLNLASTKWFVGVELGFLFFLGLGMIQVDEYALAIAAWVIFCFIWASKAASHQWKTQRPWVKALKTSGYLLLILACCVTAIVWVNIKRDDKEWTNFQKLRKREQVARNMTPTPSPTPAFNISIDYLRTDWGKAYNPRTLLMAYYKLNGVPALSPIDIWMHARIDNLQDTPQAVESWAIDSAPSPNGPWLRLTRIPSGTHMDVYVVGSVTKQKSIAFVLEDISDVLGKPLPPKGGGGAAGWILIECQSQPPCLGWYERLSIKDQTGKTFSQIISLSDYNTTLSENRVADLGGRVSTRVPPMNMDGVKVVRPFPWDAYRVEPKKTGQFIQLFK